MIYLHKCVTEVLWVCISYGVLEQCKSYFSCYGEIWNFGMRQKIYVKKLMETFSFTGIYLFQKFILGETPSFKSGDSE